ncbi:hypothetical protein VMF7928_01325 [Vibrio marisflavi CECT 7928]|uniref:Uncharacterized protein n=1 Tax=Vibrio marisflavi CECT 7928 TaxID=634439 RepID=A0ABN8E0J0_9VIBR|nr:hypothetical protein VMF7928_01325 [Vibrio marisflavi CECT 7928]
MDIQEEGVKGDRSSRVLFFWYLVCILAVLAVVIVSRL